MKQVYITCMTNDDRNHAIDWAYQLLRLTRTQQRIYLYILAQYPLIVRRSGDVSIIAYRMGCSRRTVARLLRILQQSPALAQTLEIR